MPIKVTKEVRTKKNIKGQRELHNLNCSIMIIPCYQKGEGFFYQLFNEGLVIMYGMLLSVLLIKKQLLGLFPDLSLDILFVGMMLDLVAAFIPFSHHGWCLGVALS